MATLRCFGLGMQKGARLAATGAAMFLLLSCLAMTASAQVILFAEDFEDNTNRTFTTVGEGICLGAAPDLDPGCPNGLGFFAHREDVEATSNAIGAPILTGARITQMLWDGNLDPDPLVNNVENMIDIAVSAVGWLVEPLGKTPATTTIRWLTGTEDPMNPGMGLDPGLTNIETITRLEALGYTVVQTLATPNAGIAPMNLISIDPLISDLDIFSDTIGDQNSGSWIGGPIALLNLDGGNADDLNIAGPETGAISNVSGGLLPWTVDVSGDGTGHPVLGGLVGSFNLAATAGGGYPGDLEGIGANVAPGAQILASWDLPQKRLLANLAEAQQLIDGSLNRGVEVIGGVINAADFLTTSIGSVEEGRWLTGAPPGIGDQVLNHAIPGIISEDPYAIRATGTLSVSPGTPQTFSFALSKPTTADGQMLTIDGQTVVIDDGLNTFDSFGQVSLSQGDHDFVWTSFHRGNLPQASGIVVNDGSFELSVSEIPNNSATPTLNNFWEVVGDKFSTNTRISLTPFDNSGGPLNPILGEITYDAYVLDEPGTPAKRPVVTAFEIGASLHGGGIINWQGDGFWGQVDGNHDWPAAFQGSDAENSREMIFNPIDVTAAGSDPIKLTLKLAGTPGGFEFFGHGSYDWFRVLVDPENDGSFDQVIEFNGDEFSNLNFDPDLSMIGSLDSPVTIGTAMQDVTINLPGTVNFSPSLRIKFQMRSTWVNELMAFDDVRVHTGSLAAGAPNGQLALSGFGETYTQDFDSLGAPGSSLPAGWSATTGGTTNSTITLPFPTVDVVNNAVYNAGTGTQIDRTLATGNLNGASSNAVQLWGELTGTAPVGAVMLNTRIEAWAGDSSFADDPGEAAYVISLEFDPEKDGTYDTAVTFNGGAPVTTGATLAPGAQNGNAGPNSVDFVSGLTVLASQIPAGSNIRLTFDAQGAGQTTGYLFGVDDLMFRVVAPGDTDGNGEVDSNDLFAILGAAKFNNPGLGPATWGEGDFTGDALVDSDDLFAMLGAAKFNAGPYTVESSGAAHSVMTATIDPATGIVTLDASAVGAAGEVVSGWRIQSASGIFTGDAPTIAPSFFNTDKDTEVSTGFIALTGVQELGSIIGQEHVGQSVGFYADDISGDFTMDASQGNFLLEIHVIPEPSSLMLAALGLVSLAGYGWRRRRTAA